MDKKKDLIEESIIRENEGNVLYDVTHSNYKLNGVTGTNMKKIFEKVCLQLDELRLNLDDIVEIKITPKYVDIKKLTLYEITDKDNKIKVNLCG